MQDNMQENTFICACNSYRKGFRESLKGTLGSAVDFQCSTENFVQLRFFSIKPPKGVIFIHKL